MVLPGAGLWSGRGANTTHGLEAHVTQAATRASQGMRCGSTAFLMGEHLEVGLARKPCFNHLLDFWLDLKESNQKIHLLHGNLKL